MFATITFEARHWNSNAGCFIPAAWVAHVETPEGVLPKWPCGSTREEAVESVRREFGASVVIQ